MELFFINEKHLSKSYNIFKVFRIKNVATIIVCAAVHKNISGLMKTPRINFTPYMNIIILLNVFTIK